MRESSDHAVRLSAVPLFPLPNVVLFPRAILPLHVFEERYKVMTADALRGERRIAMALLRPGWEKSYYCKPAIEPIVCVGNILTHERLPDGKYNFLLQGCRRARVVEECGSRPYRIAQLEPLEETSVLEIDLCNERQRLTWMFSDGLLGGTRLGSQFRQMLASAMSTPEIADLLAFTYLENINLKQSLLAETDVCRRVSRTITALEAMTPLLEASCRRGRNPSMN